jgi:2-oxo-4-hydroxy-4-carboxy-5-ureidoimidazoline decarboxylase
VTNCAGEVADDGVTDGRRGVAWLNALSDHDAAHELLGCCGSAAWARAVAAARPYTGSAALAAAADTAFAALAWSDVAEALAHHPRIGDRPAGADRASTWSRAEQSGVHGSAAETARDLHDGNLAYERRFGHVFLICASGLPAEQLLGALVARLGNDPGEEREIVRAELAKITHLRLTKLLEHP